MSSPSGPTVRVCYLELRQAPAEPRDRSEGQRIECERLARAEYLALYGRIGESVRWDQRLRMSAPDLDALLAGEGLGLYVLRSAQGEALGLCEFDRRDFPEIELKNFGVIPEAQGRGLGRWLLSVALRDEWQSAPSRIWLHTDNWDHPAAVRLYEEAGFRIHAIREEDPGPL
jgi:ribosomal protein S18 acetylase RimI-like enzyme